VSNVNDDSKVAARFMAVRMHPNRLRERYVRDISVKYSGDLVTAILQDLSIGLTAICLNLISNYLYDLSKETLRRKRLNRRMAAREYEKGIENLRNYIAQTRNAKKPMKRLRADLGFYEESLLRIKEQDPEIQRCVEEAICELEVKGRARLAKSVDAHWKR